MRMETRTENDMPATSTLSPAKGYISHVPVSQPLPPPPYALHPNPQPAYSISGLISPPASHSTESRRPSDDPNDYHQPHQRQSLPSLPSLSEALHYPPRSTVGPPPPPPPSQQPPHSYGNPSSYSNPPAPPPPAPRSFGGYEERPTYAPNHIHHMRRSPPPSAIHPAPSYTSTSHYAPASADRNQSLPSLRTALPSQAAPYSPHRHPEPSRYEADPRRMDGSREERPRQYNDQYYGYPTASSNAFPAPYPPRPRSPGYQSSAPYSRPEPPRPYGREDMSRPMGIKRDFDHGDPEQSLMFQRQLEHNLGNHDFEMALSELQQCGRDVSKIAEELLDAMRRSQANPDTQGMPAMRYHDQLLGCQRKVEETFSNVKHFMAQQQRQLEDHHHRLKARDGKGESYGEDEQWGMDKDHNFNGPDAKKIRRGRAAPPGRCHSCNRAETPEWRRGPDGARTLCNACGLHYAKLTRRMGSNKNGGGATSTASSALRPKSIDGSPL